MFCILNIKFSSVIVQWCDTEAYDDCLCWKWVRCYVCCVYVTMVWWWLLSALEESDGVSNLCLLLLVPWQQRAQAMALQSFFKGCLMASACCGNMSLMRMLLIKRARPQALCLSVWGWKGCRWLDRGCNREENQTRWTNTWIHLFTQKNQIEKKNKKSIIRYMSFIYWIIMIIICE